MALRNWSSRGPTVQAMATANRGARALSCAQASSGAVNARIGGWDRDPWSAGRNPADRLGGEALDDVAFLDIVEACQPNSAFEVGGNLAHVVAETAQRVDSIGGDDLAAAPDARAA